MASKLQSDSYVVVPGPALPKLDCIFESPECLLNTGSDSRGAGQGAVYAFPTGSQVMLTLLVQRPDFECRL